MGNCLLLPGKSGLKFDPESGPGLQDGPESAPGLQDGRLNLENVDDPAFAKILSLLPMQVILGYFFLIDFVNILYQGYKYCAF